MTYTQAAQDPRYRGLQLIKQGQGYWLRILPDKWLVLGKDAANAVYELHPNFYGRFNSRPVEYLGAHYALSEQVYQNGKKTR